MSMIYDNGIVRDMTPGEIAALEQVAIEKERQYWLNTPYEEAVNAEIRKRYTESQEFAVLRQAVTKPGEYEAYFAYCEECKAFVKSKKAEYT